MLGRDKRRVINTILILGLTFWLAALGTVLFFYYKLKRNQPISLKNSLPESVSEQVTLTTPIPSPTPTSLPLQPDTITFDPVNGDVFNLALPIESIDKANHSLSISYQNKRYSYHLTKLTKINLVNKNGEIKQISLDQGLQILQEGIKIKLAADKDRNITLLLIYQDKK